MLLRDRRNKMGLLRYARNDKMGMSLRGVKRRSNLKAQSGLSVKDEIASLRTQ